MAMVPTKEGSSMSYQCPILTPTNYPVWEVKVKSIMNAYNILEAIEPRGLGATVDPNKSKHALAFLFQAIPEDMVLQLAGYSDAKQVWDGLKTRYLGIDRVRTARLATLKRELEGLRMKEGELVDDFTTKLTGLASKARSLGHEIEEKELVRRLLDSMPKSFLQIVASIEQCFELDSMLFDEAVGRLKAYEERINGPIKEEDTRERLMFTKKEKEEKHVCECCGCGSSSQEDLGRGKGKGRGYGKGQDGERVQRDKSHVKCYKCSEFGHYANECPKRGKKEEANLAHYEDDNEPTLF
ncbi:hypothetical protein QVD17_24742 [Tagetes erecta]|uniref:CCHC-type domain-containing protein n=1 Tax=Tagetes erecta TaxID=13708 RepID=A0AAD8KFF3_TARER|nr:hypothetical protein QVD17_24742 [Tagetes erecta]